VSLFAFNMQGGDNKLLCCL